MSDLKNCPLCGNLLEIVRKNGSKYVRCISGICIFETARHGYHISDDELIKRCNRRPAEDAKDKEIERLKIHCNALYDSLFVLQKFFEHGASDTELSKKVQEANLTMVETIVKVLVTARKHGIDGTICADCKHRDCENCDLDVILNIQQTANAPDTGKMEEK